VLDLIPSYNIAKWIFLSLWRFSHHPGQFSNGNTNFRLSFIQYVTTSVFW